MTNLGKQERFCESCVAIPPNSEIFSSYNTHENKLRNTDNDDSPIRTMTQKLSSNYGSSGGTLNNDIAYDPNTCAGCRHQLKEGQALIALDAQWHINCFR